MSGDDFGQNRSKNRKVSRISSACRQGNISVGLLFYKRVIALCVHRKGKDARVVPKYFGSTIALVYI